MEIQPSTRVISIRVPWWLHLWYIDTRRMSQIRLLAYALYKLSKPVPDGKKHNKEYLLKANLLAALDELLAYAEADTPQGNGSIVMHK